MTIKQLSAYRLLPLQHVNTHMMVVLYLLYSYMIAVDMNRLGAQKFYDEHNKITSS